MLRITDMIGAGFLFVIGIGLGIMVLSSLPTIALVLYAVVVTILRGIRAVLTLDLARINNMIAPGKWDDMIKR